MHQCKIYFLVFSLTLIWGCALFKPDTRNLVPENLPATYSLFPENERLSDGKWWESFNTPELNQLIQMAFEENFDLRKRYALFKESRAQVKKQSSYRFPDLSLDAGAVHSKTNQTDGTETFSLGLAATYELDLWGRVKSLATSEILNMQANAVDYQTMAMTVAASVAETWVDILTNRLEIEYIKERIAINTQLLSMLERRFEKGMATAMDVLNQKEALYQSISMLPPVEAEEKVQINTLALLLGLAPGTGPGIKTKTMPDLAPFPQTGIPSDLIAMRPDIRSAGFRLRAADWQISAAKANRLPTLSLSASGAYSAEKASDVFDNWIINLAANLTGPIFDAGRRKADVDKAEAFSEQMLATYENTVFQALLEVENAMIRETKQKDYVDALTRELASVKQSYEEATRRYLAGQDTYLAMQEKMLNIQSLEISLIRQKGALFTYRIALYRSLGGNWAWNPKPGAYP